MPTRNLKKKIKKLVTFSAYQCLSVVFFERGKCQCMYYIYVSATFLRRNICVDQTFSPIIMPLFSRKYSIPMLVAVPLILITVCVTQGSKFSVRSGPESVGDTLFCTKMQFCAKKSRIDKVISLSEFITYYQLYLRKKPIFSAFSAPEMWKMLRSTPITNFTHTIL
jgi:hypothetical protein